MYYLKGMNFCGNKFLRNLFVRIEAPKTAYFAEFIFADLNKEKTQNKIPDVTRIFFYKKLFYRKPTSRASKF